MARHAIASTYVCTYLSIYDVTIIAFPNCLMPWANILFASTSLAHFNKLNPAKIHEWMQANKPHTWPHLLKTRWRMSNDGWRMTDDRWQMTDDRWRMTNVALLGHRKPYLLASLCFSHFLQISLHFYKIYAILTLGNRFLEVWISHLGYLPEKQSHYWRLWWPCMYVTPTCRFQIH